ncbi:MAG: metallophosphoesterase [Thiolinea sp.]
MENLPVRPVRLLQISDTHCYADHDARLEWSDLPVQPNRSLQRLLAHLAERAGDFAALIISGDLVQEETAASYRRVRELLQGFPLPIYTLPGNHDIPELMRSELADDHAGIYFTPQACFERWHCLLLDTSLPQHADGHLSTRQLTQFQNQLEQLKNDDQVLIIMHHHPLPIGSPWMDSMGLQQAEAFWKLAAGFPQVRALSFGHIHHEFVGHYRKSEGSDIAVYGTPATCVQLKHVGDQLEFDHTRPAWREFSLYADGRVETSVHYLDDEPTAVQP